MDKETFDELLAAVREGAHIIHGRRKPAFVAQVDADPKEVRRTLKLSQAQFACFIGVKKDTLQNWEQKRTRVPPTARVLLRIAQKHPDIVLEAVR